MSNSVLNRLLAAGVLRMNGVAGESLEFRVEGDAVSVIAPNYQKFSADLGLVRAFVAREAEAEAKAKVEAEEKAKAEAEAEAKAKEEAEAAVTIENGGAEATPETAIAAPTAEDDGDGHRASPEVVVNPGKKRRGKGS